jgi:hypothetical protein
VHPAIRSTAHPMRDRQAACRIRPADFFPERVNAEPIRKLLSVSSSPYWKYQVKATGARQATAGGSAVGEDFSSLKPKERLV